MYRVAAGKAVQFSKTCRPVASLCVRQLVGSNTALSPINPSKRRRNSATGQIKHAIFVIGCSAHPLPKSRVRRTHRKSSPGARETSAARVSWWRGDTARPAGAQKERKLSGAGFP